MKIWYCTLHQTHNWESLLLRLQGIFEGPSEVLKRKRKTERCFSIEVEIFSEKGNSVSSLYWINIKISLKELLSISLCSEAPHLALHRWKPEDLGLPGTSGCSEHFQGLLLLQQGRRDRAAIAAVRGGHFFPPFSPAVAVTPDTHNSPLSATARRVPGGRQKNESRDLAEHRSKQGGGPGWDVLPVLYLLPLQDILKGGLLLCCPISWIGSFWFGEAGII